MIGKLRYAAMIAVLLAALLPAASPSIARADTTCPEHQPVVIDIKPGSYPNSIKLSSGGLVPVAILSTATFDANQFTPVMAMLVDASTTTMDCTSATSIRYAREDVNGDGKTDIVLFFSTPSLNLTPSSTAATLMAHGSYGSTTLHVMGTDSVNIVQ